MKTMLRFSLFLLLIIFLSSVGFSAVEVFQNYDTQIKLNTNNTMDVYKSITIRNVHIVGIVPGRVEFKIAKSGENSVSDFTLSNVKVVDKVGNEIKSQIFETPKNTIIALDIYNPILPGFDYKFDLYYTLNYDSSGVFFKNMEIPVREQTSIPIKQGTFKLELPENYYFTYISNEYNDTLVKDNIAEWKINENSPPSVRVEYSYIPLQISGVKGSYMFWIIINIVLLIILSFEIRKEVRRYIKRN